MPELPTPRDIERWYPQRFDDFVGNSDLVHWAKSGLANGFANTLITGPKGTGKTRLVYLTVKAALCPRKGDDQEPCGLCPSCHAINEGRDEHWGLYSAIATSCGIYFPIDCERIPSARFDEILRDSVLEQATTMVVLDEANGLSRRGLERSLLKPIDESHCIWIALAITAIAADAKGRKRKKDGLLPEMRRRFAIKVSTSLPTRPALEKWIRAKSVSWQIEIERPKETIPLLMQRAGYRVGYVQSVFVKAAMFGRLMTYDLVAGFDFEPPA